MRAVGARVAGESVRQAEATPRAAQATWTRQQGLFREGAIAATDLETAQRAVEVARSQLQSAQITAVGSGAGGGDARVADATRVQAEAALRVAEAHLARAHIVASVDGVILRRSVEPGDVVSPARALMVLLRDGPPRRRCRRSRSVRRRRPFRPPPSRLQRHVSARACTRRRRSKKAVFRPATLISGTPLKAPDEPGGEPPKG